MATTLDALQGGPNNLTEGRTIRHVGLIKTCVLKSVSGRGYSFPVCGPPGGRNRMWETGCQIRWICSPIQQSSYDWLYGVRFILHMEVRSGQRFESHFPLHILIPLATWISKKSSIYTKPFNMNNTTLLQNTSILQKSKEQGKSLLKVGTFQLFWYTCSGKVLQTCDTI